MARMAHRPSIVTVICFIPAIPARRVCPIICLLSYALLQHRLLNGCFLYSLAEFLQHCDIDLIRESVVPDVYWLGTAHFLFLSACEQAEYVQRLQRSVHRHARLLQAQSHVDDA